MGPKVVDTTTQVELSEDLQSFLERYILKNDEFLRWALERELRMSTTRMKLEDSLNTDVIPVHLQEVQKVRCSQKMTSDDLKKNKRRGMLTKSVC